MKTLGVFSQKGGSGKTLISCHLSVAAQQSGKKTVLIDCDEQGSATSWSTSRDGDTPTVVTANPSNITQVLKAASDDGYDLAILDCPPHAVAGILTFINAADLTIVPCQPSAFDLAAAGRAVSLLSANRRPFAFVISRAPYNAPEIKDAVAALETHGPVAPTIISDRRSYGRALISGQSVTEYEKDGKAADEVRALWKWIEKEMK